MQRPAKIVTATAAIDKQRRSSRLLSPKTRRLATLLSYLFVHILLHTGEQVGELCIQPDHSRLHASQFGLKCHAFRTAGIDLAKELRPHKSSRFFRKAPPHKSAIAMSVLRWIMTGIAPLFIICSPITSFADQIWSMHKAKSSAGFSLDIPLIMLTCSILKLFYWFGARYDTPLLIQAGNMIVVQVVLLQVALIHRGPLGAQYPHPLTKPFGQEGESYITRPYSFWQWRTRPPYWQFLGYYTVTLAALQVLIGTQPLYVQLQGYVALSIEALVPIPQILQNERHRSCKGFRISVLINWLVGDTFKLTYFFFSGGAVPIAFKLCGVFQTICDIYLGIQYWQYGDGLHADDLDEKAPRIA